MERFLEKEKCTACGACRDACATHAISFSTGADGFAYPVLNKALCVDCGACRRACPILGGVETLPTKVAFAATARKAEASKNSSSGGVFALLARHLLSKGYAIFGTVLDENLVPRVAVAETADDLLPLFGSKYVRSDMDGVYKSIRGRLNGGGRVFFCGTPCQVAALKQFLGGEREGLLLADLVCHGVPDPEMMQAYVTYEGAREGSAVTGLSFRDKTAGWGTCGRISYANGKSRPLPFYNSSYYAFFMKNAIFRENCYNCPFAKEERVGDITLCDFWGVEAELPDFVAETEKKGLVGISGVLLQTAKGEEAFAEIMPLLLSKKASPLAIARHNANLREPSKRPAERATVISLYENGGFAAVDKYYHKKYRFWRLGQMGYRKAPRFLRRMIGK